VHVQDEEDSLNILIYNRLILAPIYYFTCWQICTVEGLDAHYVHIYILY